jgi:pimeloyl-ACP methyl ester carboxylesterase
VCALGPLIQWTAAQPAATVAGEWNGAIAGKLHVIVQVERVADNSYRGSMESVDQDHAKLNIDEVSFDGKRAVGFELKNISATYSAEMNAEGTEMTGIWQQSGARVPLTLRRSGTVALKTLKPVMRGRVPLQPCALSEGEGLCGIYEVYENRKTQSGRKIALHILVLPARAEKPVPDAVFGFAGGPGQSAAEAYPLLPTISLLRQQHDIVLIDQRGTGKSNPLRCTFSRSNAQALMNGPASVLDLAGCRAELEKRADLTQYTTSIFADDVDEVRDALGYDKIDLMGGSYGTLSALVYLRNHGAHVRAVVLEGVAPTDYRMPLEFAKGIQSSLEHLFADCAADADCHRDFPNLKTEFETVVKRLSQKPAEFKYEHGSDPPQPITLSRGAFVSDLRSLLYVPGIVSRLPYILHRTFENDFGPFSAVAVAMRQETGDVIARGMSFSVNCSEAVPFISEADIRRETEGTYLGDFDVRIYQKNCSQWPHAVVPREFLDSVRSDVPSLLISGAEDPATPPRLAERAAKNLSHSRVVAIRKGTHLTNSLCIDNMIVQFVNQASLEGLAAGCVEQIQSQPFLSLKQVEVLAGAGR